MSEPRIDAAESRSDLDRIKANVNAVQERVANAAKRSGRPAEDVLLVTVSKTWPAQIVQTAVNAGAVILGENRVQEAQEKIPQVDGVSAWHLIGHLQRNKAKVAVSLFDTIQSVDSIRLAKEIGKHAVSAGKEISIHLQVNTSGEASKSGVAPEALDPLLEGTTGIEGVRVEGLMTIAAHTDDEAAVRRCFAALRELRDRAVKDDPDVAQLSMGMSGDFEMAIEEGATVVRVGSAVFGNRT